MTINSITASESFDRLCLTKFQSLSKLKKGDQVAIVSPSCGLPGAFPHLFEQGLARLKSHFGLIPVEYPTTRQMGSSLPDRARDLMAAFSNPANKAVFSSIGGDDQIQLLKFLNPRVFLDNPKPFFGYSDNTNFGLYQWRLGIKSYYGGSIMCQFGLSGAMQATTIEGLDRALFKSGRFEWLPADTYTDKYLDWQEPQNLSKQTPCQKSEGWYWDGTQAAQGILWGGCLEIIDWQMKVNCWLPKPKDLKGCILFLETSEELPPASTVERVMISLGERGWLEHFAGLLFARPKSCDIAHPLSDEQSDIYRSEQRSVALRVFREYNGASPVVLNMDFGHTDPQLILPLGGTVEIDPTAQRIFGHY